MLSSEKAGPGNLFVISAASGAGKTSLVRALVKKLDGIQVSVSHTTRPRRPLEQDGIDYNFVGEKAFCDLQEKGVFLESAEVFGNYYGTSQEWVSEKLASGQDVIVEIDWQGADLLRVANVQFTGIFILPPSYEILTERLTGRASDSEETIQVRLQKARTENLNFNKYDYLLINDDFDQALIELSSIIQSERLRTGRQSLKHQAVLGSLGLLET